MSQAREIDVLMAKQVLGHHVFHEKSGAIKERLATGQTRPLRPYTLDISAAWEVVEALHMTVLPVKDGWFALVGKDHGWSSPADFLTYLQTADFATAGAAVGEKAPLTICLAALKALERRQSAAAAPDEAGLSH